MSTLFSPFDRKILPVILMPLVLTLTLLFFPSDKLIPLLPILTLFPPFDREILPVILIPLLLTLTLLFFPSDKEMPLLLILTLLFWSGKEISVLSDCLPEDKLIPSPLISTLFPSFDKEIVPVILMPSWLTLNSLVEPLLILILPCPPIVTLPSQSTEKLFVLLIHKGFFPLPVPK